MKKDFQNTDIHYDFDDLLMVPQAITTINSRTKEINPLDRHSMLPLFTAPMDTVINAQNAEIFVENKIRGILPRNVDAYNGVVSFNPDIWRSYSIEQFNAIFNEDGIRNPNPTSQMYALIDVANGHMQRIYDLIKEAKSKHDNLVVMAGNIANPLTLRFAASAGVDYIRIGIGNGNACLTTEQTGVGYPMASLIQECCYIKTTEKLNIKLVADGGMKKYSDIIKALALGADYVMLGSILNKALESCGDLYVENDSLVKGFIPIQRWRQMAEKFTLPGNPDATLVEIMNTGKLYKMYRGMSTKEVQKSWGNTELKTSEGISKYQRVEYTLEKWTNKFYDYLRTAMSYNGVRTIDEFIGEGNFRIISNNAFKRFNK